MKNQDLRFILKDTFIRTVHVYLYRNNEGKSRNEKNKEKVQNNVVLQLFYNMCSPLSCVVLHFIYIKFFYIL